MGLPLVEGGATENNSLYSPKTLSLKSTCCFPYEPTFLLRGFLMVLTAFCS
jgi:hypothetical protein